MHRAAKVEPGGTAVGEPAVGGVGESAAGVERGADGGEPAEASEHQRRLLEVIAEGGVAAAHQPGEFAPAE